MRECREKEKGKREKDLGEGERQGKREKEIEEGEECSAIREEYRTQEQ